MGLAKSMWINSSAWVARVRPILKGNLCCFPCIHAKQSVLEIILSVIFILVACLPARLTFECPSHWCQCMVLLSEFTVSDITALLSCSSNSFVVGSVTVWIMDCDLCGCTIEKYAGYVFPFSRTSANCLFAESLTVHLSLCRFTINLSLMSCPGENRCVYIFGTNWTCGIFTI